MAPVAHESREWVTMATPKLCKVVDATFVLDEFDIFLDLTLTDNGKWSNTNNNKG